MSFLTPLYLLGALAIALPILAHLIRRTPPRRREFSSVQFLAPSLPKVTRRSRIEHWPLLCLRALAIILLALAFARPLWRTTVMADPPGQARWGAVLIDTSASMRRDGLWDEARGRLEGVLGEYGPADHVGVFTFDSAPRLAWSWDAWSAQEPAQRAAAVTTALADTQPTWRGTDLGLALTTAVESLENEARQDGGVSSMEIVVISDLQSGSDLAALQGYAWPDGAAVRLVRVGADLSPDNAGLQPAPQQAAVHRVRVTNADNSAVESFALRWIDPAAQSPAPPPAAGDAPAQTEIVVPAGLSRVTRAPPAPAGSDHAVLMLHGDAHPFDNAGYFTIPRRDEFAIAYLGSDDPHDPQGQRFYLEPLFADTPQRDVTIIDWNRDSTPRLADEPEVRLVVLTDVPSDHQLGPLREFVQQGGLLIDVLGTPDAAATLGLLAGTGPIAASEAEVRGFSLLADVDFDHPALAPFADPKFSDFTTLHFWKHRRIEPAAMPQLRVLARFDDGDVAIGETPVGAGRIVFFTSGWSRADSQLAIWSKFVPLMNGLLDSLSGVRFDAAPLTVGDELPWRSVKRRPDAALTLACPDGTERALADGAAAQVAEQPGFYAVLADGESLPLARFAVNLPAAESETSPLADDQLESLGVVLSAPQRALESSPAAARQLATTELEQRQRLWRWVLTAVVILLVLETFWAGWLARRPATAE